MATSLGTYIPALSFLGNIVQDNTLVKEFLDSLYPKNLYRQDAVVERWRANQGDAQIFTRASLLAPSTTPLTPGQDPTPKAPRFEQWSVIARQYGDGMNTSMPSDFMALASLFARNAKTLGMQAAQSINRVARDKLFSAYLGGESVATASGAATTALPVQSLNGFTHQMLNGRLSAVSAQNPKTVQIAGVTGTSSVVAATPADSNDPFGPGTLTLLVAATWAASAKVRASDAPLIVRAGGAASIDTITSASALTFRDIRKGVAEMRRNQVPTFDDGMYHIHLDPHASAQLQSDNEFQRAFQGLGPEDTAFREFGIGKAIGCLFVENSEAPSIYNTGTLEASQGSRSAASFSPALQAEMRNANGVAISRTMITGKGSIMEAWIDESSEFLTAGGYTGKVGAFNVMNNGIVVEVDRVRYIIRAPIDILQQVVSQAWSFSGDWGIPSDLFGGVSPAMFKRGVVLESGTDD